MAISIWGTVLNRQTLNVWEILGLGFISIIIALVVNTPAIASTKRRLFDISELKKYKNSQINDLKKYKSSVKIVAIPILWGKLSEVLVQEKENLKKLFPKNGGNYDVNLFVFIWADDSYRIVSHTESPHARVKTISLAKDEGIVGLAVRDKSPRIGKIRETVGVATVFGPSGEEVQGQMTLTRENRDRCRQDVKWIYASPVFELKPDTPYNDKVIGVLTLDAYHDEAIGVIATQKFKDVFESALGKMSLIVLAALAFEVDATQGG
ncbi:MAG: hypothetical protein IIA72_24310 [Proteobacteria bacterium]|nr:hypothetical protein [Pseudomonadota bacterium]